MDFISPKYRVSLIENIEKAIWETYKSYTQVYMYMSGWQQYKNFDIITSLSNNIVLVPTLNNIDSETLLKIAIDLGVDTPDFIPSIPTFRNEIKAEYSTASTTFEKAYKFIESEPETAIGLANSALESIIKEILKDGRITTEWKETDTLYSLIRSLLKEFKMQSNSNMPEEIKTIGSSLAAIAQGIEKLRSDKTLFHGKTDDDYVISDPMYVYFVVNSVCTVGMFLRSFYKKHYPQQQTIEYNNEFGLDDLPL
ncbi:MAG: abortive infection family protein [Alistipes sp.]|nr:abortive infection family protein [Alistipes sp.]